MGADKTEKLSQIRSDNFLVLRIYSTLINEGMPEDAAELIGGIARDADISEERAFAALLSAFCNFDSDEDPHDLVIEREYFSHIKKLSSIPYENDPYYKNIKFPNISSGRWQMGRESYRPYEPFVWRDIVLTDEFREIPQIGFFAESFSFPAVFEDGREWMAIKPNEIETMRAPLEAVSGDVLTYGLGLGYFTYMASLKDEVRSITVVERDPEMIGLFKEHILPQFAYADKVKIVCSDAFEYAETRIKNEHFDYVFADLWHDASDGFDMYIRLKRLEKNNAGAKYLYWIEDTLLSRLRWMAYDALVAKGLSDSQIRECLESAYLKKLAYDLKRQI